MKIFLAAATTTGALKFYWRELIESISCRPTYVSRNDYGINGGGTGRVFINKGDKAATKAYAKAERTGHESILGRYRESAMDTVPDG